MRGLTFLQGNLLLNWVYYPDILKHEVSARLATYPSSYFRYALTTVIGDDNKPSYEISQLDPNYGCDVRLLLSRPESELDDISIQESIELSLEEETRITLLSSGYIGNGNIYVRYKPVNSNDDDNLSSLDTIIL